MAPTHCTACMLRRRCMKVSIIAGVVVLVGGSSVVVVRDASTCLYCVYVLLGVVFSVTVLPSCPNPWYRVVI